MPRRAAQSSPAMVQTAPGNPLPAPAALQTFQLTLADAAGTFDWTGLTGQNFRVINFEYLKTGGAGGAGDTVQLRDAAGNPITDALSLNVADQSRLRANTIDDARHTITGTGLRIVIVDGNAGATDLSGIAEVTIALV